MRVDVERQQKEWLTANIAKDSLKLRPARGFDLAAARTRKLDWFESDNGLTTAQRFFRSREPTRHRDQLHFRQESTFADDRLWESRNRPVNKVGRCQRWKTECEQHAAAEQLTVEVEQLTTQRQQLQDEQSAWAAQREQFESERQIAADELEAAREELRSQQQAIWQTKAKS
ncbi:hypothetical protein LBMAG52_18210 [Planctomycetia bacterium]|nr:hypothetical protein LBMAG52_18210 [Planctomycetia bacterium]